MSDAAPSSADAALVAETARITAKANDLDAIKRSVEDAASVSGSLWLSYLFMMFYLAIAAGAISHVDLFVENPVKLPFLGVELPLKAFFFLAPILFFVSHVYTLTYFVILSDKARRYHGELDRQIAGDGDPTSDASLRALGLRNELQRQLPSNIFVQFLAGPTDIRAGWLGSILRMIALVTLVVAPILLLLLLQVQFLPYHDSVITWTTRAFLILDMATIWWLWPTILLGRGEAFRPLDRRSVGGSVLAVGASMIAIVFSCLVATFPGEWVETQTQRLTFVPAGVVGGKREFVSLHDFIFKSPVDTLSRRRALFLSSTLVVSLFDVFENFKIKDPEKYGPYQYVLRVRGRDLRGAIFELSNLSNVDFEGAELDNASFKLARLRNASLYCAHLDDTSFDQAQLQGAWLHGAAMSHVKMTEARAQGASLEGARLVGACLRGTAFQGASFNSADLASADFEDAHLEGASFQPKTGGDDACLSRARNERGADLEGAVLDGAFLQGASFRGARVEPEALEGMRPDVSIDLPGALKPDQAALAAALKAQVCSQDTSALFVLRGLFATGHLKDAGPEAAALARSIASADCGLSDSLSPNDKAYLFSIERDAAATARK